MTSNNIADFDIDELVQNIHQSRRINCLDSYPYWHYKDSQLSAISDEIAIWQRSILGEICDFLQGKVVTLKNGQAALIREEQEYKICFDLNERKIYALSLWDDEWEKKLNCNVLYVHTNKYASEYGRARFSNGGLAHSGIQMLCRTLTELKPEKTASVNQVYNLFVDRLRVEASIPNHWVKQASAD